MPAGKSELPISASKHTSYIQPLSREEKLIKTSADGQREFLQNMLKTPGQPTKLMTGFAVSGTVSSATAAGFLPQYRGSAAASLAPTISNVVAQRDIEGAFTKPRTLRENSATSTLIGENRPLHPTAGPEDTSNGAASYLRSIVRKTDDDKMMIEQGWDKSAIGLGPGMTSDW
jgi:hypothetical protein